MAWRFSKHYSREEAQRLLPEVRHWLELLVRHQKRIVRYDQQIASLLSKGGDAGGEPVNGSLKLLVLMKDLLHEFTKREIQIKDLDRGLVDFPTILNGSEVFLCWEKSEPDIQFWHDLESGYAGREPLEPGEGFMP